MPSDEDSTAGNDWLARRRRIDSLLRLQAGAFAGDGNHHESVRMLAEALSDPEPEVRELAAAGLSEFGPDAQIALPELIAAIQDESHIVRRRAIRAIGEIGPIAADDAVTTLIAATEDIDESVTMQAAASLGEFGPAAASAIPALMAGIWSGDVRRRAVAGVALTRIGEAAVPALIQSLTHPAREVRAKCAHLLGQIGPLAAEARDSLESLRNDPDEEVRLEAEQAIKAL